MSKKISTFVPQKCGSSSVGRASASQAEGREFEPRLPLTENACESRRFYVVWVE